MLTFWHKAFLMTGLHDELTILVFIFGVTISQESRTSVPQRSARSGREGEDRGETPDSSTWAGHRAGSGLTEDEPQPQRNSLAQWVVP